MKKADFVVKSKGGMYQITASTSDVDRDGEIILPSAFAGSLPGYLSDNPVILFGHDYSKPPVGRATSGRITKKSLDLEIEFAPTPFAQEVKSLYDGGYMNTFSVGFIPKNGVYDEEAGAYTFTEAELLEVSCVPVPSNRAAVLMREAERKGFSCTAIRKELGIVDPEIDEEKDEVPQAKACAKSPYLRVAETYLRRK